MTNTAPPGWYPGQTIPGLPVARAHAEAERLRLPLPGAYDAARWTALALAVLSVLAWVNAMTG
jgi:hypothetical protein